MATEIKAKIAELNAKTLRQKSDLEGPGNAPNTPLEEKIAQLKELIQQQKSQTAEMRKVVAVFSNSDLFGADIAGIEIKLAEIEAKVAGIKKDKS